MFLLAVKTISYSGGLTFFRFNSAWRLDRFNRLDWTRSIGWERAVPLLDGRSGLAV
jgi:hypothetical protein